MQLTEPSTSATAAALLDVAAALDAAAVGSTDIDGVRRSGRLRRRAAIVAAQTLLRDAGLGDDDEDEIFDSDDDDDDDNHHILDVDAVNAAELHVAAAASTHAVSLAAVAASSFGAASSLAAAIGSSQLLASSDINSTSPSISRIVSPSSTSVESTSTMDSHHHRNAAAAAAAAAATSAAAYAASMRATQLAAANQMFAAVRSSGSISQLSPLAVFQQAQQSGGLFPLDYIQPAPLHPAATPFLLPAHSYLLSQGQTVPCHCMYPNATQPCAVHHAPIAYGQATSSSFPVVNSAPPPHTQSQQHQPPQSNNNTGVQQVTRPVAQNSLPSTQQIQQSYSSNNGVSNQQTIQNATNLPPSVQMPPPVSLTSTLPPTLPTSMRSLTMRLKRPSAQHSLNRVSSKVRRVTRDMRVTVETEQQQQQQHNEPPSTSSQLPPAPLPLQQLQLCAHCPTVGRSCISCTPCHHCVYCPHQQAGGAPPASVHPAVLTAPPPPTATNPHLLPANLISPQQQQQQAQSTTTLLQCAAQGMNGIGNGVQQVQRDPALQQQMQSLQTAPTSLLEQASLAVQVQQQQARIRQMNEAIWTQQLAAFENGAQTRPAVVTPLAFRPFPLAGSPSLYVLPRTGFPASTRIDLVFAALPHEMLVAERPTLERHATVFGGGGQPVTEPQPVGASLADIEKNSSRCEFIKDIEVPDDEKERCTVCLMEFETGEDIRTLHCTHLFHVPCIDRWLVYNKKCPVCRVEVDCPSKALLVE